MCMLGFLIFFNRIPNHVPYLAGLVDEGPFAHVILFTRHPPILNFNEADESNPIFLATSTIDGMSLKMMNNNIKTCLSFY